MAGIVYLRTNRFEVKLEGITFKARDFESLCMMDFLFSEGKVWLRPPIVGLDVMRHPRDPTIVLVLLCFGLGCVILRFRSGETLPEPILKFLTDERIRFVSFGIPEKKDLFPFEELGLTKKNVDIGYVAAKFLNDPTFKRCELAKLARKVLGIKKMVGLTEASSFERHEQIKCAICQLFISSVIAMSLLGQNNKKRLADAHKKNSFLKTLNSLPLLNEGWFKLPKGKKNNNKNSKAVETCYNLHIVKNKEAALADDSVHAKVEQATLGDNSVGPVHVNCKLATLGDDSVDSVHVKGKDCSLWDNSGKEAVCPMKRPLKGILKCPSSGLEGCNVSPPNPSCFPSTSVRGPYLKRANSKGCNVSFKNIYSV